MAKSVKPKKPNSPFSQYVNDPSLQALSDILLWKNRNKNFIDRAVHPEDKPSIQTNTLPSLQNQNIPDYVRSTHLMAHDLDRFSGTGRVYPMLVQKNPNEGLEYLNPVDAWSYADKTGEHVETPSHELAEYFSKQGYKMASDNLYRTNYKEYMKQKSGGTVPKKGKKLKIDPKYFTYENLPNTKMEDFLMANYGMNMDPGPRFPMPQMGRNLANYYQGDSPINMQPSTIQGPAQVGSIDTNKIKLPQLPGISPRDMRPPKEEREGSNFGNAALLGLAAFDAILPNDYNRQTVVQPQMAYNPFPYGTGSQALMEHGGYIIGEDENNSPSAKDGKWIQKAINPAHKGYCSPMTKSTCTPRRKALAKTLKKMAKNRKKEEGGFITDGYDQYKKGGIIPDNMSPFSPHDYAQGGNVNGGANIRTVGANYPNTDLIEQWLLYEQGGNVNGGAKLKEVGANYPNKDLMEQWLLYANGGEIDPIVPILPKDVGRYQDSLRNRVADLKQTYRNMKFLSDAEIVEARKKGGWTERHYTDMQARADAALFPFLQDMWNTRDRLNSSQNPLPLYKPKDVVKKKGKDGANINGGAKVRDVNATFPNTDLMEQWLLYQNGGEVDPIKPYGNVPIMVNSPNDPRLKSYEDSLSAYNQFYQNRKDAISLFQTGSERDILNKSSQKSYGPGNWSQSQFDPLESQINPLPNSKVKPSMVYKDGQQPLLASREFGTGFEPLDYLIGTDNFNLRAAAEYKKPVQPYVHLYKPKDVVKGKKKKNGGNLSSGKAAVGDLLTGDPTKPNLSPQERYYQSSARLSYYKDQLNQKLKAKNPKGYGDYFKGLVDLRRRGDQAGASKYVQESQYNDYLTPQEVQSSLGNRYDDYLGSIKEVNSYNVSQGQQPLYGTIEGENDLNNLNYGRRFASMQITPSASVYNQARGTRYSREYSFDPNKNEVSFSESGDMKLRPEYLSNPNTRPTPAITFHNGGVIYDDGGQIDTMWGGNAQLESYNPFDGGMVEFNGNSHAQGGIGMQYNGNPVEVEGGEFASRDPEGNLSIYGNMFIPGTKTKFKKAAGAIADKEKKYDRIASLGVGLVNDANPANKWEQLKFNAGKVMMEGGQMGMADLASKKERLSSLQKTMLDMAAEHGLDPHEMSKGKMKKAKKGAFIPSYANGGDPGDGNDPTRADRNRNPGNIKYGEFAKKYGARRDKDGFAIFPNVNSGLQAMKDLLKTKGYKDLSVRDAISRWTDNHPYRYDLGNLTGKKVSDLTSEEFEKVIGTMRVGEGTAYGVTPRTPPKSTPTSPPPQVGVPQTFTPYGIPEMSLTPETPSIRPLNPVPPYDQLEVPERGPVPSNVEPLHLNQVLGEIYGAATNKVEPVPAQRYEPQLYSPYQVSFQDRINQNQSAFNAQMRAVGGGNPSAIGTLAAQKYQADQSVLGDEFRTNQAISSDITNKNIALVNDANLKNLGIADTQMVRQSQARSNTRAQNQMIVNSLSSKYAQNEFENKRLAAYENLYDYRFVPQDDGGLSATYFGPNAMFNYQGRTAPSGKAQDVRTISRYDNQGNLKGYAEYDESDLREMQRILDIQSKQRKLPLMPLQPLK